jgi:hypothetical protein
MLVGFEVGVVDELDVDEVVEADDDDGAIDEVDVELEFEADDDVEVDDDDGVVEEVDVELELDDDGEADDDDGVIDELDDGVGFATAAVKDLVTPFRRTEIVELPNANDLSSYK